MYTLSSGAKGEIEAILKEAVDSGKAPGLVFGATSTQEELYFATYGPRTFGDPASEPLTRDSLFWICSQTKMITSIAVLQLIEAGKLHMDTPVETFLPHLANPIVLDEHSTEEKPSFRPAEKKITIRHLLSHSSGIFYSPTDGRREPHHLGPGYVSPQDAVDPIGRFYDLLKGSYPRLPLKFEPGTSWAYGWSSDTLGFIVERVSGQTLEEYFKEHIFGPLAIKSPTFYLRGEQREKVVALTYRGLDGGVAPWANQAPTIVQDPDQVHIRFGGVGLYCTMSDYLTLLRHLLQIHAGLAPNAILSAESVKSFFEPILTSEGEKAINSALGKVFGMEDGLSWSTALCVNTIDVPGRRRKGSAWWYGWAGTYHFIEPTTGIAAVLGSQLVPTRDTEILKIWEKLEGVLYSSLRKEQ